MSLVKCSVMVARTVVASPDTHRTHLPIAHAGPKVGRSRTTYDTIPTKFLVVNTCIASLQACIRACRASASQRTILSARAPMFSTYK